MRTSRQLSATVVTVVVAVVVVVAVAVPADYPKDSHYFEYAQLVCILS